MAVDNFRDTPRCEPKQVTAYDETRNIKLILGTVVHTPSTTSHPNPAEFNKRNTDFTLVFSYPEIPEKMLSSLDNDSESKL